MGDDALRCARGIVAVFVLVVVVVGVCALELLLEAEVEGVRMLTSELSALSSSGRLMFWVSNRLCNSLRVNCCLLLSFLRDIFTLPCFLRALPLYMS